VVLAMVIYARYMAAWCTLQLFTLPRKKPSFKASLFTVVQGPIKLQGSCTIYCVIPISFRNPISCRNPISFRNPNEQGIYSETRGKVRGC
jgi:hypothetical protein